MKRIMSLIILSSAMMISIASCSDQDPKIENDSTVQESQNNPRIDDESKEDDTIIEANDNGKNEEEEINESENTEVKDLDNSKDENIDKNYLTEAKIYLVDGNLTTLKKFVKPVKVTDKKVATAAVEALKDSNIDGYVSPIPSEVSFNGIEINNGIATVKYTNEGQGGLGTAGESAFVASVVYTLTEFPTIEAVKFDSQETPTILGHMDPDSNYNRNNIGNYFKVLN